MKTLIISSSLNPDSRSRELCKEAQALFAKDSAIEGRVLDLSEYELPHTMRGKLPQEIGEHIAWADHVVFGMAVYCYNYNDSLGTLLTNGSEFFKAKEGALFGIICSGGGDRSYMSTSNLVQTAMNEWRMMPLPRTVYISGSQTPQDQEIQERLQAFVDDFSRVGKKLLI